MKKMALLALALLASGISLMPTADAHDRDCNRPRRAAFINYGPGNGWGNHRGWNNGWDRQRVVYRNGWGDRRVVQYRDWDNSGWGNHPDWDDHPNNNRRWW